MSSAVHSAPPPSRSRRDRIEVRLTASQKSDIRLAAALRGQTMSEFLLVSAADAARQIVDEHTSIELTRQEQVAFVQALLNPPSAALRLQRAVETYRKATAQRVGRDELG